MVANGFRDLNTRSRMQAKAVAQNAARLRELQVGRAGDGAVCPRWREGGGGPTWIPSKGGLVQ